jgi:prepilin-type processing-associated H-X9-DG protein
MVVAIAIIAVLATLLVPAMGKARESMRSAECLSNLRQIGAAFQAYAADNNGNLPYGATANFQRMWIDKLRGYAGKNPNMRWGVPTDIFECPSLANDGKAPTWGKGYAMNDNPGYPDLVPESWKRNWEQGWAARAGEQAPRRFRLVEITYPSQRYLVGDGFSWDVGVDDLPSTYNEEAMRKNRFSAVDRHGKGRSNVLFFDGSAATLTPEQVYKSIRSPASLER